MMIIITMITTVVDSSSSIGEDLGVVIAPGVAPTMDGEVAPGLPLHPELDRDFRISIVRTPGFEFRGLRTIKESDFF